MKLNFRMMFTHPRPIKIMDQNFDPGPGFWAMVQNGPEMAQNGKSLTTPTVFKV